MFKNLLNEKLKNDDKLFINTTSNIHGSSLNSGYRLAVSGGIKDTAFDHEEIACFAAEYLLDAYPHLLKARYGIDELPQQEVEFLEELGRKRGCVKAGGHVDFHKASEILVNEIRDKTLGNITFETPEMVEKENVYFEEFQAKKIADREAKKEARGRGRKNKPKKKKSGK